MSRETTRAPEPAASAPLGLGDALSLSASLVDLAIGGETLRTATERLTRYIYESLRDPTTGRSRLALACGWVADESATLALTCCVGRRGSAAEEPTPEFATALQRALLGAPAEREGPMILVNPAGYAVAGLLGAGQTDRLALAVSGAQDRVVVLDLQTVGPLSSIAVEAFAAVAAGLKLALVPHLSRDAEGNADLVAAENTALREVVAARQLLASRWAPRLDQLGADEAPEVSLVHELTASNARFAHIARTLQRGLLPPVLPAAEGLDLGSVFHPSRGGQDVSGDFYDVFPVGRGDLVLALGDVCGKGAEAAAITAIARHTIRAVATDLRHPSQILRRLNDTMLGHDLGERFCTVVVARATRIVGGVRLSVCCAGHLPPFVVRADGSVERVGLPGSLLGLFPDIRLMEETVQLHRGDMIVAFTDGVTEAGHSEEEFGERRTEKVLASCAGATATETVGVLLDEVLRYGGQSSRDDIAIIALRVADD